MVIVSEFVSLQKSLPSAVYWDHQVKRTNFPAVQHCTTTTTLPFPNWHFPNEVCFHLESNTSQFIVGSSTNYQQNRIFALPVQSERMLVSHLCCSAVIVSCWAMGIRFFLVAISVLGVCSTKKRTSLLCSHNKRRTRYRGFFLTSNSYPL